MIKTIITVCLVTVMVTFCGFAFAWYYDRGAVQHAWCICVLATGTCFFVMGDIRVDAMLNQVSDERDS